MNVEQIADSAEQHMLDVQAEVCCVRCGQPVGTTRTLTGPAHRTCPPNAAILELVDAAQAWAAQDAAARQAAAERPDWRRRGQTAAAAGGVRVALERLQAAARKVG